MALLTTTTSLTIEWRHRWFEWRASVAYIEGTNEPVFPDSVWRVGALLVKPQRRVMDREEGVHRVATTIFGVVSLMVVLSVFARWGHQQESMYCAVT